MSVRTPKYRLHKGSGQALVQINGRRIYLGKHGSEQSKQRYRRIVAEYLRNGPAITASVAHPDELTIIELMATFMTFAESYYVKDGRMTDEIYGIRAAIRPLKEMYGRSLVRDFKPSHLKNVRQWMIEQDLSRNYIMKNVNRIRGMFRWGVENEMVPVDRIAQLSASLP